MKGRIISETEKIKEDLRELSHKIHTHPELGFEEKMAVFWQTELLKEHGFRIENPYCAMDTAYKATFPGKGKGPRIAFLAEYDALPGIGHGCGHNIIAASAVGAAVGLSKVMDALDGEIVVLGTPAEEGGGGKIIMVEKGAFRDVDFAMMIHPGTKNLIGRGGLAAVSLSVEFLGRAAHSSVPEQGINALTAVISLFNGIDVLRQRWKEGAKINGIISFGGVASNIVPDYASAKFTARARSRHNLLQMLGELQMAVKAASMITGAEPKVGIGLLYAERYPNLIMGEAFKRNMEALGETMHYPSPDEPMGSSDIGNVSLVVPTIHEYLAIAPPSVNSHSVEFREAAVSERSDTVVIKAAQGMAMTAWDILADSDLRERIYREFKEKIPITE